MTTSPVSVANIVGKFIRDFSPQNWDGWGHKNAETTKEDYILMQYTGLLDKNGKEIYEGDIIAVNEYGWEEKENYVVKYFGENGYPAFELSGWYQRDCNGLSEVSEGAEFQGEIIGNIYENPELLETKQG